MQGDTDLKGIVCAAVTPVDGRFRIDVARLAAHLDRMLGAGCDFVSVFGTTGEGASLSSRDKIAALEALSRGGADMSRHIPGIISSSIDEAAAMLRVVADLGCRAALIIPPFYYKWKEGEAVADFYEAVIEAAGSPDIDIVLYNFPFFSGVAFDVPLVKLMLDRLGDRIVAIKDSTGDLAGGLALIRAFPQLSIFTGDDRILPAMVEAGGAGMIGGTSNLWPEHAVALRRGPVSAAMTANARRRIEAIDGNGGLTVLKALLARQFDDPDWSRALPPLRAPSDESMQHVAAAIDAPLVTELS
jgi:4-hydroxy-tetrahydrodipicolinate synthase